MCRMDTLALSVSSVEMHCILVCICSVNNTTMEPTFQVLWYFGRIIKDDHIDNFFFNNYCVQPCILRFQQQGLWSRTQFMHAQALLATPRNLELCQPQCLYWEIMYNRTVKVQSHCDWVAATLGKPDLKCLKLKKKKKRKKEHKLRFTSKFASSLVCGHTTCSV